MRIEGQAKFPGELMRKGAVEGKSADSFAAVMRNSQSKLKLDSLNQLMDRIDVQGQRLAKQRTIEHLIDYKNSVKQFVSESLSYGLELSEKQSFHLNGGMKSHQLVEVIDEKLLAINDEVLDNEKDGIEVLRLVGEMKGLLVNLYM
ncbi:hypothetical protein BN1080_03339 [Planococcus massiliensis]|uniref:DUF327 domain-containing protein n=1 Tax=Planococcus massiliensis TaxID=1499687 RepID=A0A098ER84_9BACL|nr:DUF327 family protein [Planococcus massiliensis]CEG24317.1 hypothetical protein BN1080_03339 [Planococcus massiliensis]